MSAFQENTEAVVFLKGWIKETGKNVHGNQQLPTKSKFSYTFYKNK